MGAGCVVGPYCVIGEHVTLGGNCVLHSHVVIDGHTRSLATESEVFPFAALGKKTQDLKWKGGVTRLEIGDRNVFREGVNIHSATDDGNATIIGSDNLFLSNAHVAHDCVLGNHIIMSGYAAGWQGHVIVEKIMRFWAALQRCTNSAGSENFTHDWRLFAHPAGRGAVHDRGRATPPRRAPSTRSAWNETDFPLKPRRPCGRPTKFCFVKSFPFPTRC